MAGEDHFLGSRGWRLIKWIVGGMTVAGIIVGGMAVLPWLVSLAIFLGVAGGALAWGTAEGYIDWS